MSNRVLFEMAQWKRDDLIQRQTFYVDQLQARFLSQLTEEAIKDESDLAADDVWHSGKEYFDPDFHDLGDLADQAFDEGLSRWELLNELRRNLLLSSVTTLFHNWDKQIRQWLIEEISRWHRGEGLRRAIWRVSLDEIFNLLKCISIDVRSKSFFCHLDACRLIVNVSKHGDGKAFDDLKRKYPTYLRSKSSAVEGTAGVLVKHWREHNDMEIDEEKLMIFSEAFVDFWKSVPDEFMEADLKSLPKWFRDAMKLP